MTLVDSLRRRTEGRRGRLALIALFVWFFGYAHNPSQQVI